METNYPNESAAYRSARNELLQKEIELRRAIEAVAHARRDLPPGGVIPQDYVFEEIGTDGAIQKVKFSDLFESHPTLLIYSYMFGPQMNNPCSMCTPILDSLDGAIPHIKQRASIVFVSRSPAERLRAWVDKRGWKNVRLLSCANNSYNQDYWGVTPEGYDNTVFNVFKREGEEIRHFWGSELTSGPSDPGQDHRGVDFANPIFQLFDITPEGRGDHYTNLYYPNSFDLAQPRDSDMASEL